MPPVRMFVAILFAVVSSCSTPSSPPAPAPQNVQKAAPAQQPAAPPATPPTSSTPVLATADGETPGIRAEIQELKRNGGTVMLKLALVNGSSKELGFGYDFGDQAAHNIKDHSSVGGISLVDTVNKKKYLVARDSGDNCLCSRGLHNVPSGERMNVWAQFPTPPDDVQKINVEIPHFSPVADVPISR